MGTRDGLLTAFYEQSVGVAQLDLVIPIHENECFLPLSGQLEAPNPEIVPTGFDVLIERLTADGIEFGILQGYQRVILFGN